MKRSRFVVAAASTVALVGGVGTASATALTTPSPVDSSGVVHGCLTTTAVKGSHAIFLQDLGTSCPRGTTAITWNQTGPAGPKGDTGADGAPGKDGAAGTNGKDGTSVLNGAGAPANSLGQDGDFYIDTSSTTLYGPRASGAWPTQGTSLVGPQGKQGTPGTSGAQPFSVVGTPAAGGDKYLSGGPADIEAFCSGGNPELALYQQNGPAMVIQGFITTSAGSGAAYYSGNNADAPLTNGPVSFQGNTSFQQTGGMTTGTLLVTVGSSISTVTFAMSGANASCAITAQVTPSS